MAERPFAGQPASPGLATGAAFLLDVAPATDDAIVAPEARAGAVAAVADALECVAERLEALAASLLADGRREEAEIVETGALMARDPGLLEQAQRLAAEGRPAAAALVASAESHARDIAALPDPMLAARADDVRSLGRRAARIAAGVDAERIPPGSVLVANDLGPADVAEACRDAAAIALAAGGPTAHASIVARSLGLPMVTGLGPEILAIAAGEQLVVDGERGAVVASPAQDRVAQAARTVEQRSARRRRAAAERELPAVTRDGCRIAVLANVAGRAEVDVALDAGAEGVGLLRTELAFSELARWPGEAEHHRSLEPVLAPLRGRPAVVRVLDFGGDKLPGFLAGESRRGTALLLEHPEALEAQLRAILRAGVGVDLRVLFPMVDETEELDRARAALGRARELTGVDAGALGAMVETPRAAENAEALAAGSDFLSIGTNDLTATTLGVDRFAPGTPRTHHPRVLANVALTVAAAGRHGIALEVCGEAASDPVALPLLLGLGVRELSVGAARVGTVRAWVRALDLGEIEVLAQRALAAPDADAVAKLAGPLAERLRLLERGDAAGEGLERDSGVLALGPQ